MKLTFLGGANEVGASCTLLEVAGKRILIDAGIRMGAKEADQLPNLSQIQEGGPLDAILLTHAHTDHIGALPLVHIAYPQIPIFTTAPSKRLTQILLSDALRIMESRWQREQEIPLYPEHTVTAMLAQMQLIEPGQPFAVASQDIVATFMTSGHVMGACSIWLDTPDGRLFHTGDYSLDRQQTVEGMLVPRGRPDLVITESTYGNRMHANRQVEEQRLVQCVAEVVAASGKVLIPAFALGRAQEAILLLVDAQRKKRIPPFPIYIDGMVRTVCSAYASFPDYLNRDLRKRIEKLGNPFFHEGAHTVAVQAPQRQAIVDDANPCCIISSSGMLTGGPSQFYAAALAPDAKNAIFITGYQDEESPGRRVLDLADGKTRSIRFGDQEVQVACRVGRYNLSAHADSAQMLGVLSRLAPKDVYLVHGDAGARSSLAAAAGQVTKIHLPDNGQSFEHSYRRTSKYLKVVQTGVGADAPFDPETLRQHLGTRFYSPDELATLWFGSFVSPEQLQSVQAQLAKTPAGYLQHNGLFRVAANQAPGRKKRLEQNQALEMVDQLFAGQQDLYRKGVLVAQGELVLSFHFPSVALERYAERFQQIAQKTGWKVSLTPTVHQQALTNTVQTLLPLAWTLLKTPSLHLQEKRVVARVHSPEPSPDFTAIQARFLETTGHQLQLEVASPPSTTSSTPKPGAKLEINQAFARIRQAFQERQIPLFRCSLKENSWIELAMISPQVAHRHDPLRAQLEQEVGWPLRFTKEPNQDLIKKKARTLIPPEWGLKKEPAFFKEDGLVVVTLSQVPPVEAFQELSKGLEEETGYRLQVSVRP